MATRADLLELARQVRREMDSGRFAFKRYTRREFTDRLREISGEETSRVRAGTAQDIERALQEQGLRVFPTLAALDAADEARVFRASTVAANLLDVLINPSDKTDQELAEITSKIKGVWQWTVD